MKGGAEARRPEEDPGQGDEGERERRAEEGRHRPARLAPQEACAEPEPMRDAPGDEGQARAVPEPAERHGGEKGAGAERPARAGCRPWGCRGNRAESATRSCASAARNPASRSTRYGASKFCGSTIPNRSATPSAMSV